MKRFGRKGVVLAAVVAVAVLSAMAAGAAIPSSNPSWVWQNPYPSGDTFRRASFPTQQEGWAVGMTRGAFHTEDGGVTWEAQRFGPPLGFLDVCFFDTKKGWAAGESSSADDFTGGSIIWRTSDGGITWKQAYSNAQGGGLGAVTFTSKSAGWAAGRYGTVLKTTDGGKHWKKVKLPSELASYDFTDICFVDKKHGWVIGGKNSGSGSRNLVLRTSNGGSRWDAVYFETTEESVYLWEITFTSATDGWAAGDLGYIYHTSDAGATWTEQEYTHTEDLPIATDILFTDANTGFVVQDDGAIISTTDAGATWSVIAHAPSGLSALVFNGPMTGWALGADGMILRTSDGGDTWGKLTQGTTAALLGCSFASASTGWAVGTGGTVLGTTDGGATWNSLSSGTGVILRGVSFPDIRNGWAVGDAGTILHTADGGLTWAQQSSGTDYDLGGVDFVDSMRGWAVGGNATILRTEDGGASWEAQTASATIDLYAVDFVDATHGWAVGMSQREILRTEDGGENWITVEAVFSKHQIVLGLFSIRFVNLLEGWVCGAYQVGLDDTSLIAHTQDGGVTWQAQRMSVQTDHILRALSVSADGHGWAVGEHGLYMTTNDGGGIWTEGVRPCPDEWVLDMAFPTREIGYMVGSGGTVLKTTDGGVAEVEENSLSGETGLFFTGRDVEKVPSPVLFYGRGAFPLRTIGR